MRAGVVHILNGLHGPWAAMAGGSLPFGLLHVFGRLFGNPVGISLVIGTTASGLLLSILYLRFGFWAAFACHWIWNSLARAWVMYAGITSRDGIQQFEGAPETVVVLLLACLCLFAFGDRRWVFRTRS
jgi:membrane protease YdiL (CAAX protease family)